MNDTPSPPAKEPAGTPVDTPRRPSRYDWTMLVLTVIGVGLAAVQSCA